MKKENRNVRGVATGRAKHKLRQNERHWEKRGEALGEERRGTGRREERHWEKRGEALEIGRASCRERVSSPV